MRRRRSTPCVTTREAVIKALDDLDAQNGRSAPSLQRSCPARRRRAARAATRWKRNADLMTLVPGRLEHRNCRQCVDGSHARGAHRHVGSRRRTWAAAGRYRGNLNSGAAAPGDGTASLPMQSAGAHRETKTETVTDKEVQVTPTVDARTARPTRRRELRSSRSSGRAEGRTCRSRGARAHVPKGGPPSDHPPSTSPRALRTRDCGGE